MLQCVLPRRPAEAPSPLTVPAAGLPGTSTPVTPTPEVETVALWTTGGEPSSPPAPHVPAAPVREEASGYEETMAIAPEPVLAGAMPAGTPADVPAPEDETLVVAEATPPPSEEDLVVAGEVAPAPAVAAEGAEPFVVDEADVTPEPAPTVLLTSPEEVPAPAPVVAPPARPAAPPPPPVPPPATAKPSEPTPPRPAVRPAPAARPTPRPPHPSASIPPPRRDGAARHVAPPPRPAPAPAAPEGEGAEASPTPSRSAPRSTLLVVAGFVGVLVVGGLGWVAWRFLAGRPSAPAATPAPIAQATALPATPPPPTAPPAVAAPTPEPVVPATPTPGAPQTPLPTPTPASTPTPRATPTPAAGRATPTPAPVAPAPSAEALRAQQTAAQVEALLGQAETALGARQYDAAVSHLDGVLRLEPGNARATALRTDAVRRRDLAKRRFTPGQTAVQTQKAQKAADLQGFDTGDADLRKAPDFLGRIEFEMSPAGSLEPGDAWTLRVYVVNEGKKPIRVQGVSVGTSVNGAGSGGPVTPSAREIAPQQRSLVAEAKGSWRESTTSWATEVTVTANKGDSLKNTLTWR
jgi:hypothetical protein